MWGFMSGWCALIQDGFGRHVGCRNHSSDEHPRQSIIAMKFNDTLADATVDKPPTGLFSHLASRSAQPTQLRPKLSVWSRAPKKHFRCVYKNTSRLLAFCYGFSLSKRVKVTKINWIKSEARLFSEVKNCDAAESSFRRIFCFTLATDCVRRGENFSHCRWFTDLQSRFFACSSFRHELPSSSSLENETCTFCCMQICDY